MSVTLRYPEKIAFFIVAVCLILIAITFSACSACSAGDNLNVTIGMANPTAVYCKELSYEYKIITDSEGGQKGVCVFPDNTSCDAWDFFTGKCGQKYSYCRKHGYDIETVSDGKNPYSPEYAVCILPNKTKTSVIKLMDLDKKISMGSIPLEYKSINVTDIPREYKYFGVETPTKFDWRNKDSENWITPVKDQGSCRSCWAFAAVGGVEPKINIARNNPNFDVDLSEQYLVSDCCVDCGDCDGGSRLPVLCFMRDSGISDEPCFPYRASDCPCSYRCSAWNKRLWKIDDYGYVPNGRENIKNYLIEKGPLVISMDWGAGYYDNGIRRCSGSSTSWHAVVIVGYNDSGNYWIIKNSHGIGFDEGGYGKVGYGECEIEDHARYIELSQDPSIEETKVNNIQIYTGSKSGTLSDTYYKDGDYITLSEKCYITSCDGLDARIRLPVGTLQNVTSMDLIAYHRARWEDGFSLYYFDENIGGWGDLGGIPDSTWHLMKYKICDSESECASYLSSGEVLIKYYHTYCRLCDKVHVDIYWLQ